MKQTYGQYMVGSTFNPSGDEAVTRIKQLTAELIDLILEVTYENYPESDTYNFEVERYEEVFRLANIAIQHAETAAMFAVKAATKPERS